MPSLEDELFELVFEGLEDVTAASLSSALLGTDVRLPTKQEGLREVALESLPLQPGITLGDVHVRFLRYDDDVYDVEVNFRLRNATAPSHDAVVEALYGFAASLAEANGIDAYFAGIEPALDEDTRMFTGKERGPYFRLS